jgi:hypothetical protein
MVTIKIDGLQVETDAELCGREDCAALVSEGADPTEIARCREDADAALINAVGRRWVVRVATGDAAAEYTDEAWESYALLWCERYSAAHRAEARRLAGLS